MKKQLLLGFILCLGLAAIVAFKSNHNSGPKKYARLVSYIDGTMVMEYDDNTIETIKAGSIKPLAKINMVAAKGYHLVTSHGGDKYHVYVFEKE